MKSEHPLKGKGRFDISESLCPHCKKKLSVKTIQMGDMAGPDYVIKEWEFCKPCGFYHRRLNVPQVISLERYRENRRYVK